MSGRKGMAGNDLGTPAGHDGGGSPQDLAGQGALHRKVGDDDGIFWVPTPRLEQLPGNQTVSQTHRIHTEAANFGI
jgi:hypothetical protein